MKNHLGSNNQFRIQSCFKWTLKIKKKKERRSFYGK